MCVKSRVGGNVSPENVMQLADHCKPIGQHREFKRRRHRVATHVVVEAVRQRQLDVLHQPIDERRRLVRLSATTKHRM